MSDRPSILSRRAFQARLVELVGSQAQLAGEVTLDEVECREVTALLAELLGDDRRLDGPVVASRTTVDALYEEYTAHWTSLWLERLTGLGKPLHPGRRGEQSEATRHCFTSDVSEPTSHGCSPDREGMEPKEGSKSDESAPGAAFLSRGYQSFESVYEEQRHRLLQTVRSIVWTPEDAVDIVQEAFARALERWHRVGRLQSPEAWIHLVAVRLALREVHSRRRMQRSLNLLTDEMRTTEPVGHEADVEIDKLRRLPKRQREIVTLVAFSDLSTGDIAHALGISESTVRVHLARARARLRSETASE